MTIIGMLALAFRRWAQSRARRAIRRQARARLAMFDPHMLRDIGLDRATVEEEYRQPAARPLGLVPGQAHIAKRPIDLGPQLTDDDAGDWDHSGPVTETEPMTRRLPTGFAVATTVKSD